MSSFARFQTSSSSSRSRWRPRDVDTRRVRRPTASSAPVDVDTDAKCLVFSAHEYERATMERALPNATFVAARCEPSTVSLAAGYEVVCAFVDDDLGASVVDALADGGCKLILLRCAGFDNVDVETARARGISVMRVPAYDPLAISEHAVAMMLALNRHLCVSRDRVRQGNFTLDGLVGASLRGKTCGVVGTGKIGRGFAKICGDGFGMRVLGYDAFEKDDFCGEYVSLDELLRRSDVVSLHLPLTPETRGLMKKETIDKMKLGAILINTSRGPLVDARAAIDALYTGRLGALGLDVYENENRLFFKDFSSMDTTQRMMMWDETMAILGSLPQVLVTPHTAFLTHEALEEIAAVTADNYRRYLSGDPLDGPGVVVAASGELRKTR